MVVSTTDQMGLGTPLFIGCWGVVHLNPTFFIIGTDAQLNINLWKCVARKEVTL